MKKIIFTLTLLFSFITINAQVNLEDGLIAYYPFNGNADDKSGNDYHGNVFGPILTTDKDGNEDSAYYFDGVDDFIQIPDHPNLRLSDGEFSVSFWTYIENFSNPNSLAFISKRDGLNHDGYLFSAIGYDEVNNYILGRLMFFSSGNTNINPFIESQTSVSSNNWYHIVITSSTNSNSSKIYINGELDQEESALILNNSTSSDLFIGMDELTASGNYQCCNGYFFHGVMDDIRIYNRILTVDEILTLSSTVFTSSESVYSPKIKTYPNPVNNTLFIQVENEEIEEMSLINISGQSVYQGKFKNEISVSGFTSGIYFLQLKNKNGGIIKTEKVVIVNELRV